MKNYYFLITAFPPLTMGAKPELSFKELMGMLDLNLSASDKEKVEDLLRPLDFYNIRAFWMGEPLDERGKLKAKEIEEELLVKEEIPDFLAEYLQRYESTEDRLRYFASLYVSLYREASARFQGFLAKYYRFEREVRLILIGLRAKKMGKEIVRELQFEDPTDPLVADLLAQKDMPEYTVSAEYEDLKAIFMENSSDPQKLNQAILEYRFHKIEEMEEVQDFGIDRVLAYVARLMLAESLAGLDREKGREQMNQYE